MGIAYRLGGGGLDQQKRCHPLLQVPEGGDVVLECEVGGMPHPDIKWYKDGQLILEGTRVTFHETEDRAYLVIHDVQPVDEDDYTCFATNAAGEAVSNAAICVQGKSGRLNDVI